MTPHQPAEDLFWNRVLSASEAITAADQSTETLLALLAALEEGFYDSFDPADEFPAYATVSLCRSIRRHLEPRKPRQ